MATFPILLLHGVCRFDAPWRQGLPVDNTDDPQLDLLHYFKGVRLHLKAQGHDVHHSSVSWAGPVRERARQLLGNVRAVLERTGAEKVNLLAHSMGGLDARHMLFMDREHGKIHERVASLTTISTPHGGSPFADWGVKNVPALWPFAHVLGLDVRGLQDLTTAACLRFNEDAEVRRFEDQVAGTIQLKTFAGVQDILGVFGPLKFAAVVVARAEGENDGLVSLRSAAWRTDAFQRALPNTDHLNELGWWDKAQLAVGEGPVEVLRRSHALYSEIAASLP